MSAPTMEPGGGLALAGLRVLACGHGVADGKRRTWGHLVHPLERLGATVLLHDFDEVEPGGDLTDVLGWYLQSWPPDLVVHVPGQRALAPSALAAAPPSIGVLVPFELDPIAAGRRREPRAGHSIDVRVGTDVPLAVGDHLTVSTTTARHAAVVYAPMDESSCDVVDELVAAGIEPVLLDPSWERSPNHAHVARGRTGWPTVATRLAEGACVVVPSSPDRHRFDTALRVIEAAATGRPVVVVGDPADVADAIDHDVPVTFTDRRNVAEVVGRADQLPACAALPEGHRWRALWPDLVDRALATRNRVRPIAARPVHRPRVSIHLPVYDAEQYVESAIRSCLDQTFTDLEVVVLDDGSHDATAKVAEHLAELDPRVRVLRQQNIGQRKRFDVLNQILVRESRGDLVMCLGGDDLAHPERIARQIACFDTDPGLDILHSHGVAIDSTGRLLGPYFDHVAYDRWTFPRISFAMNLVAHPTVMMRMSCFDRVGPYNRGFAADYDFWLKSAGELRLQFLQERLMAYRLHEAGSSTSTTGRTIAAAESLRLRAHHRNEVTIRDLYPEIEHLGATQHTVALAYAHFGSLLLQVSSHGLAGAALAELDRSLAIEPNPDVRHNRAVALTLVGRGGEARVEQRALARAGHRHSRELGAWLDGPIDPTAPAPVIHARRIFPDLAAVVPRAADGVWTSSGALRRPLGVWCDVDWDRPELVRPVVEAWCRRFGRGEAVLLLVPHAGIEPTEALGRLGAALGPVAERLGGAADVELTGLDRAAAASDPDVHLVTSARVEADLDAALLAIERISTEVVFVDERPNLWVPW